MLQSYSNSIIQGGNCIKKIFDASDKKNKKKASIKFSQHLWPQLMLFFGINFFSEASPFFIGRLLTKRMHLFTLVIAFKSKVWLIGSVGIKRDNEK